MNNEGDISRHTARNLFTRDFILVFLAFFSFLAASQSLTPTLPIYLKRLDSNEREIGVLIGILSVTSLISRLFVGGALLKYREKSVMMVGALLSAIAFFALIVFRPFFPFLIIRILQGVALACIDTAAFAAIISITPLENRSRALGYFMLASSFALALAPPLGMFVINQYSFTILFLFGVGLSFCVLFLSWKVKGPEVTVANKATPVHSIFSFDLKIIAPTVTTFLELIVWGAVATFFPLYAIQCGVTNPGLFFSANAVMLAAGRMFGGKIMDTCNKEKIIVTSLFIIIVALIILFYSRTLTMFIVAGLLWGIGVTFFSPASMAYALEYASSPGGAAVGTYRAIHDLGIGLGPVFVGIIIPFTGYRIMFLSLAFICLINIAYFQFYVRKRRNILPTV